jgi:hypothetical protein
MFILAPGFQGDENSSDLSRSPDATANSRLGEELGAMKLKRPRTDGQKYFTSLALPMANMFL